MKPSNSVMNKKVELLKKALGKRYNKISAIAIKKVLELEPTLRKQCNLFSLNNLTQWIDEAVKEQAKAEREQVIKEFEDWYNAGECVCEICFKAFISELKQKLKEMNK